MSGMPSQHSTLTVAQESLKMGKETGDRNFKFIAMAMMGVTGLATLFHAVHTLIRDLRDDRRRGRDREPGPSTSPPAMPEHDEISRPERKWTQRPELAGRSPHSDHAQAAHREQDHARHR